MAAFRSLVFSALLAGLLAGLLLSAMQAALTTPLILQAETFEAAGHTHASAQEHGDAAGDHAHAAPVWAPADGVERLAYTVLANIVTAVGFALVLGAAADISGGLSGWRSGLFWGLGGFLAVAVAPGIGLPPELPAMPAADLQARQAWWLGTVAATGAGLALLAFSRRPAVAVLVVALVALPHLIGAPRPPASESAVPADLHQRFVQATAATGLVFWAALGSLMGALGAFRRRSEVDRPGLA